LLLLLLFVLVAEEVAEQRVFGAWIGRKRSILAGKHVDDGGHRLLGGVGIGILCGRAADAGRHLAQRDDRFGQLFAELPLALQPLRFERRNDEHQRQQHGHRLGEEQPKASEHLKIRGEYGSDRTGIVSEQSS
jgi:hypothetical protein